ncbi:hypothetical protein D3C81_609330 [compost metagenome]
MLVEALRRHVVTSDTQHRQVNRLISLMRAGYAIGQAFQGIERGDGEAAILQLVLQCLTGQLVVFQYRHAPAE